MVDQKRTSKDCKDYEASKSNTLNLLFWVLIGTVLLVLLNYILIPLGLGGAVVSGILSFIMLIAELIGLFLIVLWKLRSRNCDKQPLV